VKILMIATDPDGLAWAVRCQAAGHKVRVWYGVKSTIGDGLITKVPEWKPHMGWADLIFITENCKLGPELATYFKTGYPIVGANQKGAELELDRIKGQKVFENAGIETLEYEEFSSYDKAIAFIRKEGKAYVAKPWGGTSDKALSYVPPRGYEVEAMEWKLRRWKEEGLKGKFILQECVRGTEVGVSGWFGPGGFNRWIEEDWEEKKLMNGGLGPNTGEQGTIVRHVKESKLFDDMLLPLEDQLAKIDYVGCINVNCGMDKQGQLRPYELTMRPGWPDFDILQRLIQGDPAEWMLDLFEGKDTLKMSPKVAVGVVLSHGDYPQGELTDPAAAGFPIYGVTEANVEKISPCLIRQGKGGLETAGTYVMVVTGLGDSVSAARDDAYATIKEIKWPGDMMYRTDIGERLKKELPLLQEFGYAEGMEY